MRSKKLQPLKSIPSKGLQAFLYMGTRGDPQQIFLEKVATSMSKRGYRNFTRLILTGLF